MKTKILAYVGPDAEFTKEDANKLTHVNIAFGGIFADGRIEGEDHPKVKMVKQMKEWNPNLKVCLSLNEGDRKGFSTCAASKELREKAALNLVNIIKNTDLDGVDLDWEYPCVPSNGIAASPDDKKNFTLFCQAIRDALDANFEEHKLLTIAAGADLYFINIIEMEKVVPILDYICLMTYDLKCGFHALTGHHTALYSNTGDYFQNSCDQALKLFEKAGCPREKLLMGAAFYSRKWDDLMDVNHGFLQLAKTGGGYGPKFSDLDANYINKNGYVRYWDDEAKAPYLFNGSTFISYDDEESIELKSKYVLENGYGGIFYWEHRSDTTRKLLNKMNEVLG